MDATQYAFVHGIRSTRAALHSWNRRPWSALRGWLAGSLVAAAMLLLAVWLIAAVAHPGGAFYRSKPPLAVGTGHDVLHILGRNLLVLALHGMACVAGFIAGSSLPLQAEGRRGIARVLHERGGSVAIAFVVAATTFSLSAQAYVLGIGAARVASGLHIAPALLILGLLPHAIPELTALFLPLAAWVIASRRGDWDKLLAATLVTVALAVPVLMITALWEVFIAPRVLVALIGY